MALQMTNYKMHINLSRSHCC